MKQRVTDATVGKPLGIILSMALPLMAGNIFQNLYSVVDTAVVGRFLGINALAAVGNTGWLLYMILSIIIGVTQGAGIHIANRFGAKDIVSLRKAIAGLFTISAVLCAAMTALVQLSIRPVLLLLGFSPEIIGLSERYLRIYFAAIPIIVFYNALDAVMRSMGDTKTPFIAMITGALTNIVLDLLFIAVFGMGVAGAAAASVIAQAASVIVCLPAAVRMREYMPERSSFRDNAQTVRKELRLALPLALQHAVTAGGGLFVTHALNGYTVTFVAAFTATERLYGLMELSGMAVGYALSAFISQNIGAGKYSRVRTGSRSAAIVAMGISLVISSVLILFGRSVLSLFISNDDPAGFTATLDTAYRYLKIMCSWLPILYMLHIYRCALNGLADTVTPMLSGALEFCTRVFMTTAAVRLWSENAILRTEPMAWLTAAVLLTTVYLFRQHRLPRTDAAVVSEPQDT